MKMDKKTFMAIGTRTVLVGAGAVAAEVVQAKLIPATIKPDLSDGLVALFGAVAPALAPKKYQGYAGMIGDGMVAAKAISLTKRQMPDLFAPKDGTATPPPVKGVAGMLGRIVDEDFVTVSGAEVSASEEMPNVG